MKKENITPDEQREVTRLCVQTALLLLQHGAESTVVAQMAQRLGLALGVESVECALTANAVIITTLNGKIILFGSQARGEAREDSDWDILILLDKDKIEVADHDKFTYPFWELGWEINAMIHPIVYTLKEWSTRSHSPFRDNIELNGIALC